MINFLFCTVLPPGASKVDHTHKFDDFGQLWRLPEGEQCEIESLSLRYKLFKISFLTTFISIKTLYE